MFFFLSAGTTLVGTTLVRRRSRSAFPQQECGLLYGFELVNRNPCPRVEWPFFGCNPKKSPPPPPPPLPQEQLLQAATNFFRKKNRLSLQYTHVSVYRCSFFYFSSSETLPPEPKPIAINSTPLFTILY